MNLEELILDHFACSVDGLAVEIVGEAEMLAQIGATLKARTSYLGDWRHRQSVAAVQVGRRRNAAHRKDLRLLLVFSRSLTAGGEHENTV